MYREAAKWLENLEHKKYQTNEFPEFSLWTVNSQLSTRKWELETSTGTDKSPKKSLLYLVNVPRKIQISNIKNFQKTAPQQPTTTRKPWIQLYPLGEMRILSVHPTSQGNIKVVSENAAWEPKLLSLPSSNKPLTSHPAMSVEFRLLPQLETMKQPSPSLGWY